MRRQTLYIISLLVALLLHVGLLYSQNGVITISSAEGCVGDNISVPVYAENLVNIGAITLFIDYDPQSFQFDTISDINTSLPGLIFNDITLPPENIPIGKIGISWSGFNPANIINDDLLIISFTYINGNDSIVFSENNEVADFNANILPIDLNNGGITLDSEIIITQQPENLNLYIDETGQFSVVGINISQYVWEYKINDLWIEIPELIYFSGQNSSILTITNPDISFNERFFRCNLKGCDKAYSDSVQLLVQPNLISELARNNSFKIYPIPSVDYINIEGKYIYPGTYKISVYNSLSGLVNIGNAEVLLDGEINKTLELKNFPSGVYNLTMTSLRGNIEYQLEKIIIHK